MSLIEIRRERKKFAGGPTRPPSLWKMLLALGVVTWMLWYLGRIF